MKITNTLSSNKSYLDDDAMLAPECSLRVVPCSVL